MNIDKQLQILFDYADQAAKAEAAGVADGTTYMTTHELFESKAWVDEWLEQHPAPKKPGNRWTPDSKSRFSQWLRWRCEQAGRPQPTGARVYQLLTAAQIVLASPTFNQVENRNLPPERALRPFGWFIRNRYEDRIPDAVAIAIDHAGSADAITSTDTREAVKTWKHNVLSGRRGGKSPSTLNAVAKAHREQKKALDAIKACYELACQNEDAQAEFNELRQGIIDYFNSIAADGEAA